MIQQMDDEENSKEKPCDRALRFQLIDPWHFAAGTEFGWLGAMKNASQDSGQKIAIVPKTEEEKRELP
jgi:hypothetical protein